MGKSLNKPAEFDIQYIKGVGNVRAVVLRKTGISTLDDLLNYVPRRYLDRSTILKINQLSVDSETTVIGQVVKVKKIPRPHPRLMVTIYDKTGLLDGVWFNSVDYFNKIFQPEQEVAFSGKIGFYRGWQIVHPDFDIIDDSKEKLYTGQIIPLYPGSEELRNVGLSSKGFRRIIYNALEKFKDQIQENLPAYLIEKYQLLTRTETYRKIHFPATMKDTEQPFRRLKYEELFYFELLMALRRFYLRSPMAGITMKTSGEVIRKVLQNLPYRLTDAQRRVLYDIYDDLKSGHPMNRLLQGDVGSGKTLVALITALIAIENNCQVALMAPTEILAEQHFLNIREILKNTPVKMGLLIGSQTAADKKTIQDNISSGDIDLIIGTHALIQEKVRFHKLGLAIIDEQHRFGVLQRGELVSKGISPHVLVMTATPIPRTLAMTLFGDLDTSVIDEMPPGRKPITTVWRTEKKLNEVYKFIREKIDKGQNAYIVYPLVEESEKIDLKAATERYEFLKQKVFQEYRMALIHGRMGREEKELIMHDFKSGKVRILVSTTVIEVGVDVPGATIMLIEHAERFGLSQLHQLRGRIGRGALKSYCILITPENINETAVRRMQRMEKTQDGFLIAEEDLRLRGSGEFFGTRQHGLPDLRFTNIIEDHKIVAAAREDAFQLIDDDPQLRKKEHRVLKEYFQLHYLDKYDLIPIS
jgi:ATP-dependent DNA helicase RecG